MAGCNFGDFWVFEYAKLFKTVPKNGATISSKTKKKIASNYIPNIVI